MITSPRSDLDSDSQVDHIFEPHLQARESQRIDQTFEIQLRPQKEQCQCWQVRGFWYLLGHRVLVRRQGIAGL